MTTHLKTKKDDGSVAMMLLLLGRRAAAVTSTGPPRRPLLPLLRRGLGSGPAAAGPPRLRDYQRALLLEARRRLPLLPQSELTGDGDGHGASRRLLCPVATGLGKTVIFANLPEYLAPPGGGAGAVKLLVLVHRDELVRQAVAAFERWNPSLRVGVEKGKERVKDPGQVDVVVASVQSLGRLKAPAASDTTASSSSPSSRRLAPYLRSWLSSASNAPPSLVAVVVDEAHHVSPGSTYDAVLQHFGLGSATAAAAESTGRRQQQQQRKNGLRTVLLGFTATPFRNDGASLAHFFDDHLALPAEEREGEGGREQLDLAWGIANGFLVDIMAYRVQTVVRLDGVRVRMRDYAQSELSRAVNREDRNAAVVKAFREHGGKQGIAFCAGVPHAVALAQLFNAHGVPAAAVHGEMDPQERQRVLREFREGRLRVLTNFGVLTEGFDAPTCDTVIMCRPTLSRGLYIQMLGRATRPAVHLPVDSTAEERQALIRASAKPSMRVIDFVDNVDRHEVVTLPALLSLPRNFDAQGASLGRLLGELKHLVAEARALDLPSPDLFSKARSLDELRLLIKQFRLLGAKGLEAATTVSDIPEELRRRRPRKAKPAAPVFPQLAVAKDLRPGDKIGMGKGAAAALAAAVTGGDDGEEVPRYYAAHVVKVVAVLRPPAKRRAAGASSGGGAGKAKVAMVDGGGGCFAWETARIKDDEQEPVHAGSCYLVSGTVKRTDGAGDSAARGEVWLERVSLHCLGRDSALATVHRKALWKQAQGFQTKGVAPAAEWDAALKAHFGGGGIGLAGGAGASGISSLRPGTVIGRRPPPQPRVRKEEDSEEADEAHGLLLAPHVSSKKPR